MADTVQGHERVVRHLAGFNAAVVSGDWDSFTQRFAVDATMRFVDVPVGPFVGRAAIAQAYQQQPPTDTLTVSWVSSHGAVDMVGFVWNSGGTGTMRLCWEQNLIAELDVSFSY